MQRQKFRLGLVYGLVGLMVLVGASTGCKKKHYHVPTFNASTGDALLGGGRGIAQQIRIWTQTYESQAAPGEQSTVRIIASIEDALGQPMPDGTVVAWLSSVGTLEAATSITDHGVASILLTFPSNFNSCSRVTAICGKVEGSVHACSWTTPSTIVIWTSHTDIAWDGTTSVTAKLTTDGKPDIGYQVDFTLTSVISEFADADDFIVNVFPALSVVTDGDGNATIYLEVENTTGEAAYITVKADAEDERSATLEILVQP